MSFAWKSAKEPRHGVAEPQWDGMAGWQGGRVLQPEKPSARRRLQRAAFSQVLHTRNTHGAPWEDLKASVWGVEKQTLLRFIKMKTRHVKHIRGVAWLEGRPQCMDQIGGGPRSDQGCCACAPNGDEKYAAVTQKEAGKKRSLVRKLDSHVAQLRVGMSQLKVPHAASERFRVPQLRPCSAK